MWKTANKKGKQNKFNKSTYDLDAKSTCAPSHVNELYRNNTFTVSESSGSDSISLVKVTADRKILTKIVVDASDHHLQANLNLPELKERCAANKANKELFKLSEELNENAAEKQAESSNFKIQKQPWENIVNISSQNEKLENVNNLNKPKQVCDSKQEQTVSSLEAESKFNNSNMQTDTSSAESSYATADVGSQSTYVEKSVNTTATYIEHAAEPQLDAPKWQQTRCQQCTKIHRMKRKIIRFGHRQVSYLNLAWILFYHLIFCVCACAFLAYMLCYDAIEYVNEESRYLAKMKASSVELKCFYYIMRLLKVPIF